MIFTLLFLLLLQESQVVYSISCYCKTFSSAPRQVKINDDSIFDVPASCNGPFLDCPADHTSCYTTSILPGQADIVIQGCAQQSLPGCREIGRNGLKLAFCTFQGDKSNKEPICGCPRGVNCFCRIPPTLNALGGLMKGQHQQCQGEIVSCSVGHTKCSTGTTTGHSGESTSFQYCTPDPDHIAPLGCQVSHHEGLDVHFCTSEGDLSNVNRTCNCGNGCAIRFELMSWIMLFSATSIIRLVTY